jgi:hypothetical protein
MPLFAGRTSTMTTSFIPSWVSVGARAPLWPHHHRLVHEGGYSVTGHPAGELVFRRPDGRPLREHAESRGGSTQTLTDLNRRQRVQRGPSTITPNWHGEKLDIDWAITVLLDHH